MLIIPVTEKKAVEPRMKIWKFYLGMGPETTVVLPKGAQVLSVGTQDDLIHMWAMVDPDAARVEISKSRDVPLWMDFDPTILSDKLLERRSGAQKTKK